MPLRTSRHWQNQIGGEDHALSLSLKQSLHIKVFSLNVALCGSSLLFPSPIFWRNQFFKKYHHWTNNWKLLFFKAEVRGSFILNKDFIPWSWKKRWWLSSHIWIFHLYGYSEWISLPTRAIFLKKVSLINCIYSSLNLSPSGTAHNSSIICSWNMYLKTTKVFLIASSITAQILS